MSVHGIYMSVTMLVDRHVADMYVNLTICVDMYIPNPKITNMSYTRTDMVCT